MSTPLSETTPQQDVPPSPAQRPVSAGLTRRAVFLGMALSVFLTIWTIHSSYVVHASNITVTHLPVAALFPFVLVVLILNPFLKRIKPQSSFTPQELIVIFFLVFTASAIPGWAFSTYAISIIAGPHYFASPENRWAELFFAYLSPWLIIPNDGNAITWFFEGAPPDQPMPWQVWVVPMFWWGTFYLAIFLVGASMMVILRKQWVEHERLSFPLAQVPLMLVEGVQDGHALPRIARNRLFWFGAAFPTVILGWNMISYFGGIPPIPIGPAYNTPFTIAQSFPSIAMKFNFLTAGVAYFTRVEVLLSVWVFYLLRTIQEGVFNRVGLPNVGPTMQNQHFAGFLVFVVFGLWVARRHLRQVWEKALGRSNALDDSREFFSYRMAVIGLIGGLLYMLFWLHTAGMALEIAALLIVFLILLYLGVTRVVAETGLASLDLPYLSASEATAQFVGSANVSPQTLTTLWLSQTFSRNWRTLGMASMAHCARVGDQMGGVGKGVFATIAVTLGVSFVTSVLYTLHIGYDIGASQFTEPAFPAGSRGYWDGLAGLMGNPKTISATELFFFCLGAGISGLLVFGYHRFPWWPLHPVGFGIVTTHAAHMGVFSIFVAWFVKTLLLRFGGVQLYKRAQPFVIGMIAAYAVCVFLSFLVDLFWFPGNGHLVDDW
jgi:hypothetical protein